MSSSSNDEENEDEVEYISTDDDDSGEEDIECPICNKLYSEENKGVELNPGPINDTEKISVKCGSCKKNLRYSKSGLVKRCTMHVCRKLCHCVVHSPLKERGATIIIVEDTLKTFASE
ncbi:hypothetical protein ANN_21490 [Periplaneta americana]|uniref:Uncharacterized protein n=1 Tax=Periplaneta americana TaxID=6978 RepID=A0ABQ8SFE7_PERAM|nr:hypothetical protein ANN_21490 [Periplaneta americana]